MGLLKDDALYICCPRKTGSLYGRLQEGRTGKIMTSYLQGRGTDHDAITDFSNACF